MRTLLAATVLLATACRTGDLGRCSADSDCPSGATCDRSANVCVVSAGECFPSCSAGLTCQSAACVDVTPPEITGIVVTTPPDFGPGTYRGNDAGMLAIAAQITDVSGVQNVCLQVSGETGCPHAGTVDGGLWTFTMPRAPTAGTLDGTPVPFTIAADDAPAGRSPNHGTATGLVRFDNSGPAIRIAADPQPYARVLADGGPDVIRLQVEIVDATGVCQTGSCGPKITVGSTINSFAAQDGGAFFFDLDATKVAPGSEGTLGFTVTAQDGLGHEASATGSRFVDDKAPAVTLKVFRDGDPEPPGPVGFPIPVPNTGHDGGTFVYSDRVHLKGTIADEGGIGAASWRIDGIAMDGGVSTGTPKPLCDGGTSCAFDVQVDLNAPENGEFHTGVQRVLSSNLHATNGPTRIPVGNLQVVVTAADRTQSAAHEALAKQTTQGPSLPTTRFLWLQNLPTGSFVHGLAIHPSGDVIATTEGAGAGLADEVFALRSQGPLPDGGLSLSWSFGSAAGLGTGGFGDIFDMPAVGAGDAATAPVYVATTDGGVFAIKPDGSELWRATGLRELWTAPALVSGPAGETVVIPSAAPPAGTANVFRISSAGNGGAVVLDAGVDDDDLNSAPLVLDGGVYFGTFRSLYRLDVLDGGLSATDAGGEIWSPITDGGVLYAGTIVAGPNPIATLTTFNQSLAPQRAAPVVGAINDDLIVDMNGRVIASTRDSQLVSIDTVDGELAVLANLLTTDVGEIPLQGSDGTIYLPRQAAFLLAFTGDGTSWVFDPSGTIFRALAMDCDGRLYVASKETVYALITDDRGLADAPWPTYRRDSRATGNFGAPKYGIRVPGPDGGVCNN